MAILSNALGVLCNYKTTPDERKACVLSLSSEDAVTAAKEWRQMAVMIDATASSTNQGLTERSSAVNKLAELMARSLLVLNEQDRSKMLMWYAKMILQLYQDGNFGEARFLSAKLQLISNKQVNWLSKLPESELNTTAFSGLELSYRALSKEDFDLLQRLNAYSTVEMGESCVYIQLNLANLVEYETQLSAQKKDLEGKKELLMAHHIVVPQNPKKDQKPTDVQTPTKIQTPTNLTELKKLTMEFPNDEALNRHYNERRVIDEQLRKVNSKLDLIRKSKDALGMEMQAVTSPVPVDSTELIGFLFRCQDKQLLGLKKEVICDIIDMCIAVWPELNDVHSTNRIINDYIGKIIDSGNLRLQDLHRERIALEKRLLNTKDLPNPEKQKLTKDLELLTKNIDTEFNAIERLQRLQNIFNLNIESGNDPKTAMTKALTEVCRAIPRELLPGVIPEMAERTSLSNSEMVITEIIVPFIELKVAEKRLGEHPVSANELRGFFEPVQILQTTNNALRDSINSHRITYQEYSERNDKAPYSPTEALSETLQATLYKDAQAPIVMRFMHEGSKFVSDLVLLTSDASHDDKVEVINSMDEAEIRQAADLITLAMLIAERNIKISDPVQFAAVINLQTAFVLMCERSCLTVDVPTRALLLDWVVKLSQQLLLDGNISGLKIASAILQSRAGAEYYQVEFIVKNNLSEQDAKSGIVQANMQMKSIETTLAILSNASSTSPQLLKMDLTALDDDAPLSKKYNGAQEVIDAEKSKDIVAKNLGNYHVVLSKTQAIVGKEFKPEPRFSVHPLDYDMIQNVMVQAEVTNKSRLGPNTLLRMIDAMVATRDCPNAEAFLARMEIEIQRAENETKPDAESISELKKIVTAFTLEQQFSPNESLATHMNSAFFEVCRFQIEIDSQDSVNAKINSAIRKEQDTIESRTKIIASLDADIGSGKLTGPSATEAMARIERLKLSIEKSKTNIEGYKAVLENFNKDCNAIHHKLSPNEIVDFLISAYNKHGDKILDDENKKVSDKINPDSLLDASALGRRNSLGFFNEAILPIVDRMIAINAFTFPNEKEAKLFIEACHTFGFPILQAAEEDFMRNAKLHADPEEPAFKKTVSRIYNNERAALLTENPTSKYKETQSTMPQTQRATASVTSDSKSETSTLSGFRRLFTTITGGSIKDSSPVGTSVKSGKSGDSSQISAQSRAQSPAPVSKSMALTDKEIEHLKNQALSISKPTHKPKGSSFFSNPFKKQDPTVKMTVKSDPKKPLRKQRSQSDPSRLSVVPETSINDMDGAVETVALKSSSSGQPAFPKDLVDLPFKSHVATTPVQSDKGKGKEKEKEKEKEPEIKRARSNSLFTPKTLSRRSAAQPSPSADLVDLNEGYAGLYRPGVDKELFFKTIANRPDAQEVLNTLIVDAGITAKEMLDGTSNITIPEMTWDKVSRDIDIMRLALDQVTATPLANVSTFGPRSYFANPLFGQNDEPVSADESSSETKKADDAGPAGKKTTTTEKTDNADATRKKKSKQKKTTEPGASEEPSGKKKKSKFRPGRDSSE